jgi:eukaryotic-like serine/threonine-protein kinase
MARAGTTTHAVVLPDRYRVVRHLARGGMASVWEAEDEILQRRVAVKVLAEHLAEDVSARERFQREARAAASVSDHHNVVTIFDVSEGDDGGRPFIVMELLTGGTVAQRLREGRPSNAEALDWLRQAAAAIDDAHAGGLVHRDIKPANLLLDGRGRLAVTDFGIARLAHDQTVTTTGQVLGTAAYLSPEQACGKPATAASDRYALAVVAFQLLTGQRPFRAEHFAAQARQHIEVAPPPASSVRPDLQPGVDTALGRGLAKEPGRRWPSAGAMVQALEKALKEQPAERTEPTRKLVSRPAGARPPVPVSPPVPARPVDDRPGTVAPRRDRDDEVPSPGAFPARVQRRRRPLWAIVAALAVLAIVGAIFALASGGGSKQVARVDHATNKRAQVSERRRAQEGKSSSSKSNAQPTPDATPATQTTSTPATGSSGSGGGDPEALNNQGFQLLQSGQAGQAVPVLQRAVDACNNDPSRLVCAYAMFNLAQALRLSGHPEQAVPLLEKRLQNPDQRSTVQRELALAKAGSTSASSSSGGQSSSSSSSPGNGKKAGKDPKPGKGAGD